MILRFADCDVDLDRLEVRVAGTPVAVEPQVFDVLSYLIEHRDRMVTKEELLDNIWGDRFVSESALTSRIKSARRALGDDGRTQAVIKTIHGRGYRFVAPVEQHVEPLDTPTPTPTDAPATLGATRTEIELDEPAEWPLVGRHDEMGTLDRVFHEPGGHGVLVTGPAGIGKTRLAQHSASRLAAAGLQVVHVNGHAEAAAVPLACLSHVLPSDVLDAGQHEGEMARALVFRRARHALEALANDGPIVVVVDNADQIDELSNALLASLAEAGHAFLILTQRTEPGDPLVMDEHIRSGLIHHLQLGPLDDTDLDVLLYRVLEGPIDLTSLEQLTRLSRGRPGALRQLLDTTLSTSSLGRESGVWRLTGAIQATAATDDHARLSALEPAARAGAELLAIASSLGLDLATELIGAAELDILDRVGLLTLSSGARPKISLAQPHIALLLLDDIGPLRARRHKARLVAALSAEELGPDDRLRVIRWSIETGGTPDREMVVEAARLAVSAADSDDGDVLLDHLDAHHPSVRNRQLRGELAFRRGQIDAAERIFFQIPPHELEPETEAAVIRRRATILFHIRGRYDAALELLATQEATVDEPLRSLLGAHWVGLQAFLGRADALLERCDRFPPDLDGAPALEVLRARATASMLQGRFHDTHEFLREHASTSIVLPAAAAQPANEVAASIGIAAHVAAGDLRSATEMVRHHLPLGRRSVLAWLPLAAARSELAAGRPRSARELLVPSLAAVRNQNLMQHEPLLLAVIAQANALSGDIDEARDQVAAAAEWIPELAGQMQAFLVLSLGGAWSELGERDRVIEHSLSAAEEARRVGAVVTEAQLLGTAGTAGAATDVVERIAELADRIEGALWPLITRHIEALADDDSDAVAAIVEEYRRLGFMRMVALADRD